MSKRRTRRERGRKTAAQYAAAQKSIHSLHRQLGQLATSLEAARADARSARERAADELVRSWAGEVDITKYLLRECAGKIGQELGTQIARQVRAHDPVFEQRRSVANAIMDCAAAGLRADAIWNDHSDYAIVRVDLPALRQSFTIR